MTGTLRKDLMAFMTICNSVLRRMTGISDESCRANQNTFCVNNFLFTESRAVYEVMWDNMVQPD